MADMDQGVAEMAAGAAGTKTLALIDGANFMFRSYHAMKSMGRDLSAPDGTPTAALMNFASMVGKAKVTAGADAVAIIFESTTGNFRDGLFAEYKANRVPTPSDVKIQMNLARDLFPLMGVPVLWADGFEADDLLCAYAHHAPAGWRVAMCSSDKDLGQSVGAKAVQLDPNGWKIMDEAALVAKHGVGPALIAEYLALQGDSVDNIPGVDLCGAKTAAKLLNKHGSIEAIYGSLDTLTPKLKENFIAARERIPGLLKLTRADLNVALPMTPDQIWAANREPKWQEALPELRRLSLGKLIAKAEKAILAMELRDARLGAGAPRI